ncbi:hypothetical protein CEP53_011832 [Fusarium sp. AF-6]|nr:hypothetical protein CEP53_011832 [Fusarium sp. AF-6]
MEIGVEERRAGLEFVPDLGDAGPGPYDIELEVDERIREFPLQIRLVALESPHILTPQKGDIATLPKHTRDVRRVCDHDHLSRSIYHEATADDLDVAVSNHDLFTLTLYPQY